MCAYLSIQGFAILLYFLFDDGLDDIGILLQFEELLHQRVDIQPIDVLAVVAHSHARHQRRDLFVIRERDDRLVEQQGQQDVVKAGGNDDVRFRELSDELFDGR